MPDPGPALLAAALGAARGAVERAVALEVDALAQTIGVQPAAAAITAAKLQLVEARARAGAFATTLASVPANPAASVRTAADQLAATIAALDRACTALGGPPDALARLAASAMGAAAPAGHLASQLRLSADASPWRVEGTTLSYRLGAPQSWSVSAGPMKVALGKATVVARVDWANRRVTIGLDAEATVGVDADFLAQLAGTGRSLSMTAPVSIGVDPERGLTVGSGGRRRTALPALPAGSATTPIKVRDLTVGVVDGAGAGLEVTSVLSGSLGTALDVVLQGAGLRIAVDPSAATPLSAAVRPPDGGRLSLQAGIVRGGGTISHRGSDYLGTLALAIGPTSAKAIVLIGTEPSFSMTLLLFAELPTPVQLGFGFTLNGVGGLIAVDRALSTDAFVARLHDGTVDAILFPPNRSQIKLETVQAVFPRRAGAFAVGPAFELGWGVPTLVTGKLGVFLVLPDTRVVVLGTVRVAIPSPAVPIVDMRATIVGELREDRLLLRIGLDPGSRVAGYPLSGDLGVLVRTGRSPDFAIAAGGFHPGYRGPAELAGLRRLAIDLSPPAIISLRADAYVALTSNALMLGAHVELAVKLPVAEAHGYLSFDAIATFDPFRVIVDVRAGISVSVLGETIAGVQLALHLEGPSPWVASGTATLSLFFLPDIDLSFGPLRWPAGAALPPPPNPISALAIAADALEEPAAARSILPPGVNEVVRLRVVADRTGVACHPLGTVELRQQAVPLETDLATIGSRPTFERRITITSVSVGGLTSQATSARTTDLFAPGQFLKLRDDERLSRPAFEPHTSGVRAAAARATVTGPTREVDIDWETIVPHATPSGGVGAVPASATSGSLAVSAVARARAPAALYTVAGQPLGTLT